MKNISIVYCLILNLVWAQWSSDSSQNIVVESAVETQLNPLVETALDGSIYIAWGDRRSNPNYDYRLKRFSFNGNEIESYTLSTQHTSSVAGNIESFKSDKENGVYLLWEQVTGSQDELRLQHINSTMNVDGIGMAENGMVISDIDCDRKNSSMLVVDRDNVIISYTTSSCSGSDATSYGRAYIQKISKGLLMWDSKGKMAASRNTNGNDVLNTKLVRGPENGAFIIFSQNTTSDNALRINYVDGQGTFAEGLTYPSGIGLGSLYNKNNWELDAVSDGSNGIFIVWRNSSNKIVLQHIDLINNRLVATNNNPVEVFSSTASYVYPRIDLANTASSDKGIFILFYDYNSSSNAYGLFAKYLNKPDGSLSNLFTVSTNASQPNFSARQVHDINATRFDNEAYVTWLGKEGDLLARKIFINSSNELDATAQTLIVHDKSGATGRSSPGAYNADHDQLGGLVVVWQQDRGNNLSSDIFAQQLGNMGTLGVNADILSDIANQQIFEDQDHRIPFSFHLSSPVRSLFNFVSILSDPLVTASVSNDTLIINFPENWNGGLFVKFSIDWIDLLLPNDTTSFIVNVSSVQDAPKPFQWVSSATDTINITKTNLQDSYNLQWSESIDVDNDTIDYLIYARVGVYPAEEVYDTTGINFPIPYQDLLNNVFESTPGPGSTVYFNVKATDGIDTVNISGEDRMVYVNRYDYLSTKDITTPTDFALHDNFPNPFNPTTQIRFDLPIKGDVRFTIYNMLGHKVREYNMKGLSAGYHTLTWNATNNLGSPVSSGIYFYQIQTKELLKTKRMVLLK